MRNNNQAKPLYPAFIEKAKSLNAKQIVMIIPSRWYAGGIGLNEFRSNMLNDNSIKTMVHYTNAKDCFSDVSVSGGIAYFLRDASYSGLCNYTNIYDNKSVTQLRSLSDYKIFIKCNTGYNIIKKIKAFNEPSMRSIVSSLNPFGIPSFERGNKKQSKSDLVLHSSAGKGYINNISKGFKYLNKHKVMVSKTTSEHAGEPGKNGMFKVLSKIKVLQPGEVCTFSYFLIGYEIEEEKIIYIYNYLKTKFARFLLLQAITSINISRKSFMFVPLQDFSITWTDDLLYKKYGLNTDEIAFIEARIKPME